MSEYKKVKIGDFLTESKEESFDSDASKRITVRLNCKGIEQRSLKAEKEGATKYFVRHSGQFIYGKQNFHKGAFGIIPEKLDGFTSSADLPAFDFTNTSCCPEYLNLWFQVDERYKRLQKNVKGVGSQRLAVSIFLNQEILLPDLETQKEIVKKVSINLKNVETLTKEIDSQKAYVKQLRQNILQDAIEGKLTAEWRKIHPVIKGNPDFDAEALFEEVQKGKAFPSLQPAKQSSATPSAGSNAARNARSKELPPITDDEKPFEIPEGWKWVRLGDVVYTLSGYAFKSEDFLEKGKYRLLRGINLGVGVVRWDDTVFINTITAHLNEYKIKKNDIILGLDRPWISEGIRVAVYDIQEDSYLVQRVLRIRESSVILKEIIVMLLKSKFFKNAVESQTTGISVPHISPNQVCNFVIPLPPLLEQIEIVKKEDAILTKIELIEKQIVQRKEYIQQLMQSILKDTFEGK